jgi:glycine/D-amino acid oxidase-like deaminating enzyme
MTDQDYSAKAAYTVRTYILRSIFPDYQQHVDNVELTSGELTNTARADESIRLTIVALWRELLKLNAEELHALSKAHQTLDRQTGHLRLAGTVVLAGLDAAPDWRRARVLLSHARRMFPALRDDYPDERIAMWMGHRPSVPDSLPVIGASRRARDVVYAFGHGHIGMACAANTGKTVAELVSGEQPGIDPAPFSPQRFS